MSDIRDFQFRDYTPAISPDCRPSFQFRDFPDSISQPTAFPFRDYGETIPATPCTAGDDFWATPDGDAWTTPDGDEWEAIPDP